MQRLPLSGRLIVDPLVAVLGTSEYSRRSNGSGEHAWSRTFDFYTNRTERSDSPITRAAASFTGRLFTIMHYVRLHVGISPLPTGFPRRLGLVADFYFGAEIDPLVSGDQWAAVVRDSE